MRIIVERLHDHWSAWVEGHAETGFGGRTPKRAVKRLLDALGIGFSQIAPSAEATPPGRMVFISGEPCPDCGGSGKYVGLLQVEDCSACGGSGRVGTDRIPF